MNMSNAMHHQSEKTRTTLERALLLCGILSSLLYIGGDILAVMWYPGYSYMNQTISQLAAIGAPTRPFVDTVDTVVGALVIAFGIGVWASAGRKRSLRITGMLVTIYGVLGFVEGPFSAMQAE